MNKSSISNSSLRAKIQIKIVMGITVWLSLGKRSMSPLVSIFQDLNYWPVAENWHKSSSLLLGRRGWIPNLLPAALGKPQCLDTRHSFMSGKHCWAWKTSFSVMSGEASRWSSGLRGLLVSCDTLYDGPDGQLRYVSCRFPNLAAAFFPPLPVPVCSHCCSFFLQPLHRMPVPWWFQRCSLPLHSQPHCSLPTVLLSDLH